jgi:hypothetical protein
MVLPPTHPRMKAIKAEQKEIAQQKANQAQAEASRKGSRGKGIKATRLDSLKQINLNAAGLDIGASEIWACVPEGRWSQPGFIGFRSMSFWKPEALRFIWSMPATSAM